MALRLMTLPSRPEGQPDQGALLVEGLAQRAALPVRRRCLPQHRRGLLLGGVKSLCYSVQAEDTVSSSEPARVPDGRAWWSAAACIGLAFVALRLLPHLEVGGTSFPGYWLVAREWAAGTPVVQLYDDAFLAERLAAHGFVGDKLFGPPSLVLTAVPVAWLPYGTARAAWMLGLLGPLLLLSLGWLMRPLGWAGLGLLIAFAFSAPVSANMEVAQIYPLMLAAHCLGLHGWRKGQAISSAAGLAPMIAVRGWYGLPQAFGWLVARRPRGFVATGAGAAVLIGLSVPVVGWAAWEHFLTIQLPEAGSSDRVVVLAYQTWRSLALHLTTFHPVWSPDPPLPALGPVPYLAGVVFIGVLSLWAGSRCRPGADGGVGFALWTTVALLLSPAAEDHHFVLTAVPVAVLWGRRGPSRVLPVLILLASALLLPDWTYDVPELRGGWRSLLAYPRVYGTGLLWMACVWAAWRGDGEGASEQESAQ